MLFYLNALKVDEGSTGLLALKRKEIPGLLTIKGWGTLIQLIIVFPEYQVNCFRKNIFP